MNQIKKHTFEAVSLLTPDNGMLELTIIPAMNQPDWVIPTSLILSTEEQNERVWNHLWQNQEVTVFHLCPPDQALDKLIVLEGNTEVHRLALQTQGELRHAKFRISDVKDVELPERYTTNKTEDRNSSDNKQVSDGNITEQIFYGLNEMGTYDGHCSENEVLSYLFQAVMIDNVVYLVPDLDKIAYHLVDLDSI